jgi:nitroreductase
MELVEAIETRRAVRGYAATSVEKATLERLLDLAVRAPSASNSQPWAFGILQGAEVLRSYSDRAKVLCLSLIDSSPGPANYRRALSDPAFNIFYDAPALVCIYAKPTALWPHPKNDCALAAQNLMLAAHDLGLGTCWIGFAQWLFDSAELKRELGVPEHYLAVGQLVVGYPQGKLPAPTSRQVPEVVFWK